MNRKLINRICLGTAQFGLDYGIANKEGKISKKEAFNILKYAYSSGVDSLDTAFSYQDSEKVIGDFVEHTGRHFKIISKLPFLEKSNNNEREIENLFFESLSKLKIKKIYGYLIHKFKDFLEKPIIWNVLEGLKDKHVVQKIGFSIYTTDELETIIDKVKAFDIIQIPYSVFDRRFERYLPILKKRKIEICIRSVFLQGLAFLKHYELPPALVKAKESLEYLQNLSETEAISINSLCLNFVLLNPYIDKLVVGVDSLAHLAEDIKAIGLSKKVGKIITKLDKLEIKDESIILPYKWESK